MDIVKYLERNYSQRQSNFSIPVQIAKPESHPCISCGFDTLLKQGREVYDRVTKREQFFCFDCFNTSEAVFRIVRGNPYNFNHHDYEWFRKRRESRERELRRKMESRC